VKNNHKMTRYKIVNIIAIIICLSGIGFQLYSDAYLEGDNDNGTLIVIAGLFISVANQFFKEKEFKKES